MGVGHLNIGVGQGSADLYNANPVIQQYTGMLAKQQQKREAENKYLNDELAKSYDPSVLRNDADKQEYLTQYNQIKKAAIDAENETNQTKKTLAISNVRQQLANLDAFSAGSKKQGLFERTLAPELMKNPDHYEDESVNKYKAGLALPWNHPDIVNNASQIERRVDPNKLAQQYKSFKDMLIKPTQWDNGTTTEQHDFDGKKWQVVTQNRGIPIDGDNGAYESMLHYVSAHPEWKKGLRDMYPNVPGETPQIQDALRVRQYMHDNGDEKGFYDKPKETRYEGQTPQRWSLLQQWNMEHTGNPNGPNAAIAGQPTPAQTLITGMQAGQPGSGEKLISLAPKGQYGTAKPVIRIDPTTGEHWFSFPAQIESVKKNVEANAAARAAAKLDNRQVEPDELKPETIVKKPAKDYRINPASPDYVAQAAQMAKEQNINLDQLNKIEGVKGGHGQIPQAQAKPQAARPAVKQAASTGMIRVKLPNGTMGEIPSSKFDEFKKNYPGAEKIQ